MTASLGFLGLFCDVFRGALLILHFEVAQATLLKPTRLLNLYSTDALALYTGCSHSLIQLFTAKHIPAGFQTKETTTPFGMDSMKGRVLYRAAGAQASKRVLCRMLSVFGRVFHCRTHISNSATRSLAAVLQKPLARVVFFQQTTQLTISMHSL